MPIFDVSHGLTKIHNDGEIRRKKEQKQEHNSIHHYNYNQHHGDIHEICMIMMVICISMYTIILYSIIYDHDGHNHTISYDGHTNPHEIT